MNPFEMVIAIVAIVTIGGIIRARMGVGRDNQGNEFSLHSNATSAENERLRDDIRGLKERIAVLERVITDTNGATNLDREIEALRNRDQTGR